MRSFLRQRWFLLLLTGGGVLALFCPSWLNWTRALDPRLVVAPSLFLTACGLESRSLYRALLRPWPALWAVAVSYGILPATAWLLASMIPSTDFGIGLLVIACVPCTLASAMLWTRFAGGNEAVALLVILLTTCTSWAATTAWLTCAAGAPMAVDSAAMMRGLFLVLVVPVVLGQALRAVPVLATSVDRHRVLFGVIARLFILVIIWKAMLDVVERLSGGERFQVGALAAAAAACVGLHVFALVVAFWGGRLLRFDRVDRIAATFSASQKTLPVALFLFDAYLKDDYPLAVVPMAFYHVGQFIVDTFIADGMSHASEEASRTPSNEGSRAEVG